MELKLEKEIDSFKNLWKGGFRTGYDNVKRNKMELEEFIKKDIKSKYGGNFLEIGCGGGQWSKIIYNEGIFNQMYCIDVLSETHNNFWNYIGEYDKSKIKYCQVNSFNLDCIPDDSLDYVFSYDVFCHISYSGIKEYLKNLYKKCRKNCKIVIMYADAKKFIESEPENIDFVIRQKKRCYLKLEKISKDKKYNMNNIHELGGVTEVIKHAIEDCDGYPYEGRWYFVGIDNFISFSNQYKIVNRDIDIDKTNPITILEK